MNAEEIFIKYFEAARRNDTEALNYLIEYLKIISKPIVYKFYYLLKDFGIELRYLFELQKFYIFEFLNEYELIAENHISYFKGYMTFKFHSYYDSETTEKRKLLYYAQSFDEPLNDDNTQTYHDVLGTSDNFNDWYEKEEIFQTFIYDNTNKYLSFAEKTVLHNRIIGMSFQEIAKENNMSYRVVLTIYQTAITKLKNKLLID